MKIGGIRSKAHPFSALLPESKVCVFSLLGAPLLALFLIKGGTGGSYRSNILDTFIFIQKRSFWLAHMSTCHASKVEQMYPTHLNLNVFSLGQGLSNALRFMTHTGVCS